MKHVIRHSASALGTVMFGLGILFSLHQFWLAVMKLSDPTLILPNLNSDNLFLALLVAGMGKVLILLRRIWEDLEK